MSTAELQEWFQWDRGKADAGYPLLRSRQDDQFTCASNAAVSIRQERLNSKEIRYRPGFGKQYGIEVSGDTLSAGDGTRSLPDDQSHVAGGRGQERSWPTGLIEPLRSCQSVTRLISLVESIAGRYPRLSRLIDLERCRFGLRRDPDIMIGR